MRRFVLKAFFATFVLFMAVTVSSVRGENPPAPQPQDSVAVAVPEVKKQNVSEPQSQQPAEAATPPVQQQDVPKPAKSMLPFPAAFMQKFAQPKQVPAETAQPVSSQAAPQVKTEVKPEPTPEIKPEIKPEPKPGNKPEAKPEQPVPPAAPHAVSEAKSEVKPEVKPAPIVVAQTAAPAAPVSFFFDDADIFEVAQTIFGDVLKVNYIIDPKVKGRVNFRTTTPITRSDILPVMEIILRLNGIAVVEEKGLYRLIPLNDIAREPAPVRFGKEPETVELKGTALVQIVPLQNIGSADMARILMPLLSQGGAVIDVSRNFLIIADTDANVKRLLQLVRIFDSEQLGHIRPQVFVYPVQNSKAKAVAEMLQQIFLGAKAPAASKTATQQKTTAQTGFPMVTQPTPQPPQSQASSGAAGGEVLVSDTTRIIPDETTNSIVILATPDDYLAIAETIKKIDIVPRQVMIEAVIAEITLTDSMTFGLEWSLNTDIKKTINPFTRPVELSGAIGSSTGVDTTTGGFTFVGTDYAGIVRAKLQALATDNKVNVLSSPHILVSDNHEARIQIGDQVPIATSQTTNTGTIPAQTTTTIQYKDTGTILKVKPQVNDSGLVSLEITQEVSDFSTQDLFGAKQVIINKREAATTMVAQDGQTIVIGGLIKDKANRTKTGIPFLSDIPLLGYLFGKTTDDTNRTELIILLVPHVIRNQAEANNVTAEYIRRLRGVGEKIKREGLIKGDAQGQTMDAVSKAEKN